MIVLICSNLDKLLAIYIIIVIKKKLLRQKSCSNHFRNNQLQF